MIQFFDEYLTLRNDIDQQCNTLSELHKNFMKCRPGCSMCCQSFRMLPVEFYAIQHAANLPDYTPDKAVPDGECRFLKDGQCILYENRPIMCRTHGFPLIRLNEEAGGYEVSFCELNFKQFKLREFNEENVMHEDPINSRLFMLNKRFIEKYYSGIYEPVQLIELNELGRKVKNKSA